MLKKLSLTNFRNHNNLNIEFHPGITVIIGENAAGKTNILEAIYLLALGESFRAKKIEEMVSWKAEAGHVAGELVPSASFLVFSQTLNTKDQSPRTTLQVTVTRGVVQGKKVQKRLYRINGVGRRKQDLTGNLPVVLFRPEDMDLLVGNPSNRRQFLNEILVQTDKEYLRSLQSYEKGLKQRNRLLDLIRDGNVNRTALAFWDQLLIKEGNYLTRKRDDLMSTINQTPSFLGKLSVIYDRSTISPERLDQYREEELAAGYTLVGPHKDDFRVMDTIAGSDSRDLSIYGSRGEQRMTVLWLKQVQLSVMEKVMGFRPLLLLDDVLSELDESHASEVVGLASKQQTIVTSTSKDEVKDFGDNHIIALDGK